MDLRHQRCEQIPYQRQFCSCKHGCSTETQLPDSLPLHDTTPRILCCVALPGPCAVLHPNPDNADQAVFCPKLFPKSGDQQEPIGRAPHRARRAQPILAVRVVAAKTPLRPARAYRLVRIPLPEFPIDRERSPKPARRYLRLLSQWTLSTRYSACANDQGWARTAGSRQRLVSSSGAAASLPPTVNAY